MGPASSGRSGPRAELDNFRRRVFLTDAPVFQRQFGESLFDIGFGGCHFDHPGFVFRDEVSCRRGKKVCIHIFHHKTLHERLGQKIGERRSGARWPGKSGIVQGNERVPLKFVPTMSGRRDHADMGEARGLDMSEQRIRQRRYRFADCSGVHGRSPVPKRLERAIVGRNEPPRSDQENVAVFKRGSCRIEDTFVISSDKALFGAKQNDARPGLACAGRRSIGMSSQSESCSNRFVDNARIGIDALKDGAGLLHPAGRDASKGLVPRPEMSIGRVT